MKMMKKMNMIKIKKKMKMIMMKMNIMKIMKKKKIITTMINNFLNIPHIKEIELKRLNLVKQL